MIFWPMSTIILYFSYKVKKRKISSEILNIHISNKHIRTNVCVCVFYLNYNFFYQYTVCLLHNYLKKYK